MWPRRQPVGREGDILAPSPRGMVDEQRPLAELNAYVALQLCRISGVVVREGVDPGHRDVDIVPLWDPTNSQGSPNIDVAVELVA